MEVACSPTSKVASRLETLGAVTYLLLKTERSSFRISALKYWIEPAIDVRQIQVFYRPEDGHPIGYCTWAFVGDDLIKKLLHSDVIALHLSEWNEGLNLWIVDFVAINGYAASIARWLRANTFRHSIVAYGCRGDVEDGSRKNFVFRRPAGTLSSVSDSAQPRMER